MNTWDKLSMAERAEVMRLAVENGIYDLGIIRDGYNEFAKGGRIHIKPENRGKFTALKKRTGHSATWFKEHGTPAQKKMATFALNARKWKHEDGGNLYGGGGIAGITTGMFPGVTENETTRDILGWLPYTSTVIDIDNARKDPSPSNLTWAGVSAGLDLLTAGIYGKLKRGLRGVNKAIEVAEKEATSAAKRAERAEKVYKQANNVKTYELNLKAQREAFEKSYKLNNSVDGLYLQRQNYLDDLNKWAPWTLEGMGGVYSQGIQTFFDNANKTSK